jgi:hypothetical protein
MLPVAIGAFGGCFETAEFSALALLCLPVTDGEDIGFSILSD